MSTTAQTLMVAEAFFFSKDRGEIRQRLWGANPAQHHELSTAETLEDARAAVRRTLVEAEEKTMASDFMGEAETSPIDLVTRRYPRIAILKPFNTCAQICVYCQRNWEIDECMAPDAAASTADIDPRWSGSPRTRTSTRS